MLEGFIKTPFKVEIEAKNEDELDSILEKMIDSGDPEEQIVEGEAEVWYEIIEPKE